MFLKLAKILSLFIILHLIIMPLLNIIQIIVINDQAMKRTLLRGNCEEASIR